jgi:hypothetical protein
MNLFRHEDNEQARLARLQVLAQQSLFSGKAALMPERRKQILLARSARF